MTTLIACLTALSFATPAAATHSAPQVVRARVKGSIDATLQGQTPEHGPALASQIARLLRWHGDVARAVHPNDSLVVAYTIEGGEPILVALRYAGAAMQLNAYRFADADGVLRYYDGRGRLIEPVLQHSPARYVQITETVQNGRGKRRHRGIDLKGDEGTLVNTPWSATVTRINWSTRLNGNCVEVRYTSGPARGALARFLHLQKIKSGLRAGQQLDPGRTIGLLGNTGRSSAAHLHYEIRDGERVLAPLKVHGRGEGHVSRARMKRFEQQRNELETYLAERHAAAAIRTTAAAL